MLKKVVLYLLSMFLLTYKQTYLRIENINVKTVVDN